MIEISKEIPGYLKAGHQTSNTRAAKRNMLAASAVLAVLILTPIRPKGLWGLNFDGVDGDWAIGILMVLLLWFGVGFALNAWSDYTRYQATLDDLMSGDLIDKPTREDIVNAHLEIRKAIEDRSAHIKMLVEMPEYIQQPEVQDADSPESKRPARVDRARLPQTRRQTPARGTELRPHG